MIYYLKTRISPSGWSSCGLDIFFFHCDWVKGHQELEYPVPLCGEENLPEGSSLTTPPRSGLCGS